MQTISLNGKIIAMQRIQMTAGVKYILTIQTAKSEVEMENKGNNLDAINALNKLRPGDNVKFCYHATRHNKNILTSIRKEY